MSSYDPTGVEAMDEIVWLDEMTIDDLAAVGDGYESSPDATMMEAEEGQELAGTGLPIGLPKPYKPLMPRPIRIAKRNVSGRYEGQLSSWMLVLRVDVDGATPLKRVSGDFFQVSGATTSYYGSFVVQSPTVTVSSTQVSVKGAGSFTFAAAAPVVQVVIPRRYVIQPAAAATVTFFKTNGSPALTYTCPFKSKYFRTVRIETDRVSDVTDAVFSNYDTASLPSGGAARTLSVVNAYAEAGIEMVPTSGSDVVEIAHAGGNAIWSNAELHAAMQEHFSLWKDSPQWAVWLLVARLHDLGSGLYGIMFDQQGKQRQGCAVFHHGIGGTSAEKLRLQLYTYVHELGHCFNLLHSWQKEYASPPVPNRVDALSWMNYPWYYPSGGAAGFWNAFPFCFDTQELIHLRHAFWKNVVMGGNDFIVGSALGRDIMPDSVRDESGLVFAISTHKNGFALGEPVVLELSLANVSSGDRQIHTWLHPNCGMVKIVIRKPNGEVVGYEPYIDHLVGDRLTTLARGESVRDSAYVGFGKDGFYFDMPGTYQLRACYAAVDGSLVLSSPCFVRVRYPVNEADEELADLFMGEDQGALLYLLGSDNPRLSNGNEAFDYVLEKYPKHGMANYARLVKGVNARRQFKMITKDPGKPVLIRDPKLDESASLLTAVGDSNILDTVSAQMVFENLAEVNTQRGDKNAAKKAKDRLDAMKADDSK